MSPKFSVVIPLYNSEEYIKSTIDSVLAQTERNFEIIIVDDGSPCKQGADIVRSYSDSRIRLIEQSNRGLPEARNRGIKESKGEFIAFLDGDDQWYPFHLKAAADFFECNPWAGWYVSHLIEVRWGEMPPPQKYKERAFTFRQPLDGIAPSHSSATIIRRTMIVSSGGFPSKFVRGEEDRIAYAKLAAILPIVGVYKGISVVYNKRSGSITNTTVKKRKYDFWKSVFDALIEIPLNKARTTNFSAREVSQFLIFWGLFSESSLELNRNLDRSRKCFSLISYGAYKLAIKLREWLLGDESVLGESSKNVVEGGVGYLLDFQYLTWKQKFLRLRTADLRYCHIAKYKVYLLMCMLLVARCLALSGNKMRRILEFLETRRLKELLKKSN